MIIDDTVLMPSSICLCIFFLSILIATGFPFNFALKTKATVPLLIGLKLFSNGFTDFTASVYGNLMVRNNVSIGTITAPTSTTTALYVVEPSRQTTSVNSASIIIARQPTSSGGVSGESSIVFKSATNGDDFGYIRFVDNIDGGSGERARMIIGVENNVHDDNSGNDLTPYQEAMIKNS